MLVQKARAQGEMRVICGDIEACRKRNAAVAATFRPSGNAAGAAAGEEALRVQYMYKDFLDFPFPIGHSEI